MEPATRGFDPTLPLDFDGSTNMMDLPDITLGNGAGIPGNESHHQSQSTSGSPAPLLKPMVNISNSGRMSPVRGRTMKEYDQQISDLKKENFNLKLRIYFLEERMQQKYGDEDIYKTNIELKVTLESLKKELEDKHELLLKASQAMESLTANQESEITAIRKSMEEEHRKYLDDLRTDLQKALQEAEDCQQEAGATREKLMDMEVKLQQLEAEKQQSSIATQKLKDALNMKERELSELRQDADNTIHSLEQAQHLMREAEEEREAAKLRAEQMEKELERRERDVDQLSTALKDTSMIDGQSFLAPTHLQDVVDDQQAALARLEGNVQELQEALASKEDMLGKLEDGLREKDKAWKDAANKAEQLAAELEQEQEYGSRRDKTIQGLVTSLHKKEKEVKGMKDKLAKTEEVLKSMRDELHDAQMEKHKEVQQLQEQLADTEDNNSRLQTQLSVANADAENMIKSLGKKEGELVGFREQLAKANQALKHSEEALEALQEQLERERDQAHSKLDSQVKQYQHILEDYMHQLEGKDSLMAQMTAQLRAKDKQLTSLMDLLTDDTNKSQKAVLQRLEDGLNKTVDSAQNALEQKQAELEQRDRELREARKALQDKSHDLEQAALRLLEHQQELEKLHMRNKEQCGATAQLSAAVARAQNALEESLERHAAALQEKDGIVQRLQHSLAEKEHMIEELMNKTPATDKQHQQLRAQLREKDQLIQELQTECVQASCEKDKLAHNLQAQIQEKDAEIEAMTRKQQKELANRNQEIQQLTAQLGKKGMQLQGLESRMALTEEQQQEAVDRLRRMMAEKDRTIEALVDSVGEKERLLRRSQQNLTEDAKAQLAEMDTLMAENARLRGLLKEKEAALAEMTRNASNNKETLHSSYHETITHTMADNTQMCRLLEEQVRETHALCELLRQERQVSVTFNDRPSDFTSGEEVFRDSQGTQRTELSAVERLCQRLEAGADRNRQLHRSLLGHSTRPTDHLTSSDSSAEGGHFDFHHHHHHHRFDDVDGYPSTSASTVSTVSNNNTPAYINRNIAAVTPQEPGTSSFAVQTSPALGQMSPVGGDRLAAHLQTTASQTLADDSQSTLVCHCPSSGEHLDRDQALLQGSRSSLRSLSSTQLEGMSAAVLRDLVSQLQEDLVAAAQQNTILTHQLQQLNRDRTVDGDGDGDERVLSSLHTKKSSSSDSTEELQTELESVREALHLKEEDMSSLRRQCGLSDSASGSGVDATQVQQPADLQQQVQDLRKQVKDMSKINNFLQQQIVLNSQSEDAPQGFNPQLIVDMAAEIERLKTENSHFRRQVRECSALEHSGHPESEFVSDTLNGNDSANVSNGQSSASLLDAKRKQKGSPVRTSPSTPGPTRASASAINLSLVQEESMDSGGLAESAHPQVSRLTASTALVDLDQAPCRVGSGGARSGSSVSRLAKLLKGGAESVSSQPLVSVSRKLQDAQEQVRSLEDRLQATEGTVRYMSQRLRHYRALAEGHKKEGLPRSRSDACLSSQRSMSLSFSCGDLQEAAREAAHGSSPSAAFSVDSSCLWRSIARDDPELAEAHMMIGELQQQIRALNERHAQELEVREGELVRLRQTVRQSPPGQEEDGGANPTMRSESSWVSSLSRETMRHDRWPSGTLQGRMGSHHPGDTTLNASHAVSNPSRGSVSIWSNRTETTSLPSSRHHGDLSVLVIPEDTTFLTGVGEDVQDTMLLDNLTYSSFSESILPVGASHNHHDSAWSSPRTAHLRGGGGAARARRVNTDSQAMSPLVRSDGVRGKEQFSARAGDDGSPQDNQVLNGQRDGQLLDTGDESQSCKDQSLSSSEAMRLQAKVMVLTDMNRTMREELRIYDSMCRSLGVQVTPGVTTGSGESSGEDSCDGEIRLLQLHLTELRRLRSRLEQLDTDAHNAAQLSSLLNDQHIRRISELEALLTQVRDQLKEQEDLACDRQSIIIEREKVIKEMTLIVELHEKAAKQLQEKVAALETSETERAQQQDAAVEELQRQLEDLQDQLAESQQQEAKAETKLSESQKHLDELGNKLGQAQQCMKSLEAELMQSRQRGQALELKLSQSVQQRKDLESRLTESEQQRVSLESELAQAQDKVDSLESSMAEDRLQSSTLRTELDEAKKRLRSLETELAETRKRVNCLNTDLTKSKKNASMLEIELKKSEQHHQILDSKKKELQDYKEKLESDLEEAYREGQVAKRRAAEVTLREEECAQLKQRVQHFQERMVHYEECMRESQQQAADSESKVRELQEALHTSQSHEEEARAELHAAHNRVQQLEAQVKDTEENACMNKSIALRADMLARTLEGRVRDLEGAVKEAEDEARGNELQAKQVQATLAEQSAAMETLRREMSERNAKLKKRDAQLKKLVEEYKKVAAAQKEVSQLNQALKCELKLYETMHSQAEMSRDKKEELMQQLLSELSQTRRLAEDLIARLERVRHNESPPSSNGATGPEAADGRPSPEPRDNIHQIVMTSTSHRIHTDSPTAAAESLASSHSDSEGQNSARLSESPGLHSMSPLSTPSGSDGGHRLSATMPSTALTTLSAFSVDRSQGETGQSKGQINMWEQESHQSRSSASGVGLNSDDLGRNHTRSQTYPFSLKYWQDRNATFNFPSALPRVEVDSDIRRLFAISGLEGYEKMRRENTELISILASMQARMTDRLKAFASISITEIIKSVEYSTLRELQMAAQNLRICAEEESRLLSGFWLTQLPPMNVHGEFYDPKATEENDNLKVELRKQKSRYDLLAHTVREQQERLHATNALRKKWETTLYKQLSHTTQVLGHAKENFDAAGLVPAKHKSPRKSQAQRKVKDKN